MLKMSQDGKGVCSVQTTLGFESGLPPERKEAEEPLPGPPLNVPTVLPGRLEKNMFSIPLATLAQDLKGEC
ncbi:hypothetical protein I79_005317 [Cricetulus griseus]|uniref:Uncharacterized protein n=1 Tax=Cricetulus griseus TaxID=10029 RepID=G3H4V5_CRIGR|nr:hypothetical protein I79_005317 [Cricetulus griseus]